MKNTGLILEAPKVRDWIFGGISGAERKIQNISADWRSEVPPGELQKRGGLETMSCVSQASNNQLEILLYSIYKIKHALADRADRYLAKISGTTTKGNSFRNVGEAIKSSGVPHESSWPWPKKFTWQEFYKEVPRESIDEGLEFRDKYKPQYEWVWPRLDGSDKKTVLYEALKFGPLLVCNTYHAYVLLKVEGTKGWIFDSYEPFIKEKPLAEIEAAMLFTMANPDTTYTPPVKLPDECLVFESGGVGKFALHLRGKLILDELAKIQAVWTMRNSVDNFFKGGNTRNLVTEDFHAFRQVTLKGTPINF
ncbi:MAG: hypothetical protein JRL30_25945 [Deltaproteobacteria bacterium]|nr:hypothetical protein [Deltaproteobacteria bacterium]